MKEEQGFKTQFAKFPALIKSLIDKVHSDSERYCLEFRIKSKESGRLDFLQRLGHKDVVILSLDLFVCGDDFVRHMINFKVNSVKGKLEVMTHRYDALMRLLEDKNDSLYKQAIRIPARLGKDFRLARLTSIVNK